MQPMRLYSVMNHQSAVACLAATAAPARRAVSCVPRMRLEPRFARFRGSNGLVSV
jgi:hypothetical protein